MRTNLTPVYGWFKVVSSHSLCTWINPSLLLLGWAGLLNPSRTRPLHFQGGGTSRLLYDYDEPYRTTILDALFNTRDGGKHIHNSFILFCRGFWFNV